MQQMKKRILKKSHLKTCGRRICKPTTIHLFKYPNDCRHSNQVQRTSISDIKYECIHSLEIFAHYSFILQLMLANNDLFNDAKNEQMEHKENNNEKQRIVRQPRCDIYRKTFAAEQQKKLEEVVTNPEVNMYVLLRGVSIHESEDEIKEILADYETIP
ncbi:hypothetical protein RFI_35652 [Reticulomyxa filosa]|uniref:Uncharacterized protein n=1 Tax=Reticulomyxa filosa TaxID=46433 RepID=X6LKX7_RETFI|nr:hypothetical protein RFI_35652 [Reticulomyxa filosa]|eukprot:ETO01787.1 hypothetical protein RFI_35652 [Reticulomyxa filosa]